MITSEHFDRVKYLFPKLHSKGEEITSLLGLDSEALTTGKPFLFCMSDGQKLIPPEEGEEIGLSCLRWLLTYIKADIAVYNLKYDSGAVLYGLPSDNLLELWEKTFTTVKMDKRRIRLEYIPHKALFILEGKKIRIRLWDISQFFASSLDSAANRYLGRRKLDIDTKAFTPTIVKRRLNEITKYCLQDAVLCADLGIFLVAKLKEFGIRTTSLYSSASLSFRYFADNAPKIVTSWRLWKNYRESLRYAVDSYEGGKFEITARGSFHGYEYDLSSAYPCEIAALVDISLAEVVKDRKYRSDAYYGFIRVKVHNHGRHIPCGLMRNNVRIYPNGDFYLTITKGELDYLREIGVDVDILSGYWIIVGSRHYPYRDTVGQLFKLKSAYKGKDAMLYEVSKRMLNSFYGKTVQMIDNYKGEVVAGIGWNPLYGSIITANTRIKMARLQNLLGERCLAVHTDSVITLDPLPPETVTGRLGELDFVEQGEGILLACGQYEIGEKAAYKGFRPLDGDNWRQILEANPHSAIIDYPVVRVESWIEALSKGHINTTNVFCEETKKINLNADTKRTWKRRIVARDLLTRLEQSLPAVRVETEPPAYWGPL